jgi:parallel beta-helix repeat protein
MAGMIHKLVFSWRGALLGVLASSAAVGFAIPAIAATPIMPLTSCQAITASGTYRLDADVSSSSIFSDCFDIGASNVTLMLNGHKITGPGEVGISVNAGVTNANIVGPGTVTVWRDDIQLAGSMSSVRGVNLTNPAFYGDGIFVTDFGSANSIVGNVLTGNAEGIAMNFGTTDNRIIGNTATSNGIDLFDEDFTCTSNVWKGNDFTTASPSCIH